MLYTNYLPIVQEPLGQPLLKKEFDTRDEYNNNSANYLPSNYDTISAPVGP